MGKPNQPRDRRGRWTETGRGSSLGSQRQDFAKALQHQGKAGDNDGRSTVYAYLRDKDSPNGKAGSPYYIGVAGDAFRPYASHGRLPVPSDERRIRMLRSGLTHEQARKWERHYIEKFGRADISSGRAMTHNRTAGGDGLIGFKHSGDTKAKISAAHSGKKLSAEHRAKMSAALRNPSFDTREKMRASQTGRRHSEETKAKMSNAHRGKLHTTESKAKMSAAARERGMMPDVVAKGHAAWKGKQHTKETKAKMSASQTGKLRSPETKANISLAKLNISAARHAIDPALWVKLSIAQRANAPRRAQMQGITVAQYVQKMRHKWGV